MAKKTRNLTRRYLLLGFTVILITGIVIYFLFGRQSSTVIPSTNPVGPSSSYNNKSSSTPTAGSNAPTASSPTSSDSTKDSATSPTPYSLLIAPYGNFVSNHHPGGSAPTAEASVCNTTPGASCYIQFTKNADVKKLTAQTTGSNGATYWNWDINEAGLSQGSWTITAIATLDGQSKSAKDTQELVVQ